MTPIDVETAPAALVRLATAAAAVGWDVTATVADGPPPSIALRFGHGEHRAYGVWKLNEGGKVNFSSACARHLPPGKFTTLAGLKRYLGVS